jgi:hypothetical protein
MVHMNDITIGGAIGVIVVILAVGLPTYLICRWAYRDGVARGKPGWLVALLVLSGGGFLAWLALRPDVVHKSRIHEKYLSNTNDFLS